jgi:hypothetical protein
MSQHPQLSLFISSLAGNSSGMAVTLWTLLTCAELAHSKRPRVCVFSDLTDCLLLLLLLLLLQVLVHLCYVLPAPACHIYRDMKPGRMQQVLAQRAMLEKELRGHLVELVYQQQLIQGWLKAVSFIASQCPGRVGEGECWRKSCEDTWWSLKHQGGLGAPGGCPGGGNARSSWMQLQLHFNLSPYVLTAMLRCAAVHLSSLQLQARQPRVDKSLNPDSVLQSQQQLLNLKAALGRTRSTLHTLQDRAAAYSDRDYVQHTRVFADFLSEIEDLAELQHNHGAPCVLQLQKLQEAAARRVLFARTQDAVSALHCEAGARAKALLQSEQPLLDSTKQRVEQLRAHMQAFDWRYPPSQFVAWRFKGAGKGARSPWGRTPGVQRREPKARFRGEQQLQQQQPGAPPPLLGS